MVRDSSSRVYNAWRELRQHTPNVMAPMVVESRFFSHRSDMTFPDRPIDSSLSNNDELFQYINVTVDNYDDSLQSARLRQALNLADPDEYHQNHPVRAAAAFRPLRGGNVHTRCATFYRPVFYRPVFAACKNAARLSISGASCGKLRIAWVVRCGL